MRSGKATARLIPKGLGASLAAAAGLIFLASPLLALTWGEINQNLGQGMTLTKAATIQIREVKPSSIRDGQSRKKAVAHVKKAEDRLRQVVDIYQTLAQADLPPAKVVPFVIRDIKALIARNVGMAKQSLGQAQSLRELLKGEPMAYFTGRPAQQFLHPNSQLKVAEMQKTLVISMEELQSQTSWLQKRLQAQKLR